VKHIDKCPGIQLFNNASAMVDNTHLTNTYRKASSLHAITETYERDPREASTLLPLTESSPSDLSQQLALNAG